MWSPACRLNSPSSQPRSLGLLHRPLLLFPHQRSTPDVPIRSQTFLLRRLFLWYPPSTYYCLWTLALLTMLHLAMRLPSTESMRQADENNIRCLVSNTPNLSSSICVVLHDDAHDLNADGTYYTMHNLALCLYSLFAVQSRHLSPQKSRRHAFDQYFRVPWQMKLHYDSYTVTTDCGSNPASAPTSELFNTLPYMVWW